MAEHSTDLNETTTATDEPAAAFDDELAEYEEGAHLLLKGLVVGAIAALAVIATIVAVIIRRR